MRIVVLAGGIGGARFLLGVRAVARELRRRGDRRGQRRRRRDHARPADLPRPGQRDVHAGRRRPTPSAAGAGSARPGSSRTSWPPTGPSRPGSASATRTSPPTSCAPGCSHAGYPLSAVTEALCDRWQPGSRLLPATDDRLETHVGGRGRRRDAGRSTSRSGGSATGRGAAGAAVRLRRRRVGQAARAGVLDADRRRRRGPARAEQPGRSASRRSWPWPACATRWSSGPAPVVGVSPIIGGAPVRGMADSAWRRSACRARAAGVGALLRRSRRRRHARRLAGRHGGRGHARSPGVDGAAARCG